jgi:amino acid adenylation domain-containing protein
MEDRHAEFGQATGLPRYAPVPQLVASVAARYPARTAITSGDDVWTYAQLAGHAAGVADGLLEDGLTGGDVVAVTGRHTPELIACMLGVLACGCVLLPVDPALPEQRQSLLLASAGARRVLRSCGTHEASDLVRLAMRVEADAPAYVMFTSGTTGLPRGVLGRHRGLSHFLSWQREEFAVGAADRCAQLTGLSFDVVLRDVFLPLISGAVLCLPSSGEPPAPDDTLAWLRQEQITLLHAVPTVMRAWLDDVRLDSLRVVFFAGEPLHGELVDEFRTRVSPSADIVNLYGPTETTLAKSYYRVPAPALPAVQPVGHPLPGTQIFVQSSDGRLCDDGEQGEILISTPFRTAGYLDGTGFEPNPFGSGERDLVFRTGDRGYRLPDGMLVVTGRLDDQIKINGVRIAPAEVTAALLAHPEVADAIVLGHEVPGSGARLDGFVVLSPLARSSSAQIRADLERSLPSVMVPSAITIVPGLPVTANGKLDRVALLALVSRPGARGDRSASRLSVIGDIWSDVLEQKVDATDDFFALGGHSLHAALILSRIRKELGVDLPMRVLFERPTLGEFLSAAEQGDDGYEEPPLIALDRSPDYD